MARMPMNLQVQLLRVQCHDEADGIGDAEPYLWPVFFKVDGDSYAVTSAGLIGFPQIHVTGGEHGNLNTDDVDAGDRVSIPESIGSWVTQLKPIPVYDPSFKIVLGDDQPGIAGLVVVLMEEDGWPNDIATTAYAALANAVHLGAAKALASFQNRQPTPETVDAQIEIVKEEAAKAVRAAVQEYMSGAQILWYGTFGNNDDKIGSEAWVVTQDDLDGIHAISFRRHWDDDESDGNGDWSINGAFINLDVAPAATSCEDIQAAIDSLKEELQQETDAHERQRIHQAIDGHMRRAKEMGCPIR